MDPNQHMYDPNQHVYDPNQQMYDPNQNGTVGGHGGYQHPVPQYPLPPQFQGQPYNPPESDEDEEYDEERLMQAERELSEDAPWKKIQQNTFTRWVNEKLKVTNDPNMVVVNLQVDFKDGLKLARLVEVLAEKKIAGITKKARIQIQQLGNITAVLDFLKRENIDLVTIDSSHINGGNMKLILALIWALILHYSIALARWNDEDDLENPSKSGRERLLKWMDNYVTGHYAGPKVNNFNKDWNDGTKLGALVDSKAPGLCPDWDEWNPNNAFDNANKAMDLAQNHLDVPKLIAPEEIISPSVDDKAVMTYLSQFPKAKPKPDAPLKPFCKPQRARAFGPGVELNGCVVNVQTHFTIETYGAGQGTIEVLISDPSTNPVTSQVTFNNDHYKTYSVTYTPVKAGQHKVEVRYSGMPIRDSPFTVNVGGVVGDAGKCRAAGPGLALKGLQANHPTFFEVFTENAGNGNVDVYITDPNGQSETVQMKIDKTAATTYTVKYMASIGGAHTIKVTFSGRHIPGSPFTVNMADPDKGPARNDPRKVYVTGRGVQPKGLRVTEVANFIVHTKEAGEGEPSVSVLGPGGSPVPCSMTPAGNGEYECVYHPKIAGPYKVIVKFVEVDIPRSPFQVLVEEKSTIRVIAYGPGLYGGKVNHPAAFTVDTCGEPDANLGFSIEGPSEAQIDAEDNKDGSCKAKYLPTVAGDYIIHITCNNEDIKDSPFSARITPADLQSLPVDPSQVTITGPGVQPHGNSVNKTTQIIIVFPPSTPQGYMPKLDVLIMDRDGERVPTLPIQTLEQFPPKFSVQYCPVKDQKHTIYVSEQEVAAGDSPYQVYIDKGYDLGDVKVLNLKPTVFVEGFHDFLVDARSQIYRVGNEEVKVVIASPSSKKTAAKVKPVGDGTYDVGYVVKEIGLHSIEVLYQGVAIPDSPFKVNAIKGRDVTKVIAVGPGLKEGVVGKEAHFMVISKNAGPGSLGVYIEGPSEAKTTFKDNKDGTCSLAYLPTKAGEYSITIKYEDEFIPDSPFHAMIYPSDQDLLNKADPSKVKVIGLNPGPQPGSAKGPLGSPMVSVDPPTTVVASEPQEFFVDASEAGEAPLRCTITDPDNKELPTQVFDNRNGTYNVGWTPEDVGPHKVAVNYGGQPVPGSVFPVNSVPTGSAGAVVPPDIKHVIPVNIEYPFVVDASKAGRGKVVCSLTGPDGEKYPVTVNQRPYENICDCSFRPNFPGSYQLAIKFGGNPVKGSPFKVLATDSDQTDFGDEPLTPTSAKPNQSSPAFKPMVDPSQKPYNNLADPSKVKVCDLKPGSQPGSGPVTVGLPATVVASEPQQFLVDASKTGTAPLKCTILDPKGEELPTKIADNENGTHTVHWVPEDVGPHKVHVLYNGKPVPGSPFNTNATPTGNAGGVVPPNIKDTVPVGVDYPFTVDATRTGPGRGHVTCSVIAPNGKKYPLLVKQKPDQKIYECVFKPHIPGLHKVNVKFAGNPIQGSPYNTTAAEMQPEYVDDSVTPANVHPNYQPNSPFLPMGGPDQPPVYGGNPSKVKVSGLKPASQPAKSPVGSPVVDQPGTATAGELQQFGVDASQAGHAPLQCAATDPTNRELPMKMTDNKNGTYNVQWTPEDVGPHKIKVYYDGKPVPGSPFTVNCKPSGNAGAVIPPNIKSAIPLNVDYPFTVDASKAGRGNITCSADGPDGKRYAVTVIERQNQKVFECKFRPQELGPYQLNILFGGSPIKGSPFNTNAIDSGYGDNSGLPLAPEDQITPSSLNKLPFSPFKPLSDPSKKPYNNLADPSKVKVSDPKSSPQTGGSPMGPVAVGLPPTVTVSEPQQFVVDASKTGSAPMLCVIVGPTNDEVPIAVADNEDGTYTVNWVPEDLGPHKADVLYNGQPVPGSPFATNATPAAGNPSAVVPPNIKPMVPVGVDYPFTVDASRTGPGPGNVTCSAVAPDGKKYPVHIKQRPGQKMYDCTYKPHLPGPHRLNVKFAGNPIKESPFSTTAVEMQPDDIDEPVTPSTVHPNYQPNSPFLPMSGPEQPPIQGADVSKVKVAGLKPTPQKTGRLPMGAASVDQPASVTASEPQQFSVDASKAGPAAMRCAVTDPSNRELPMKVADNKNGTYNVQWTPEEVGPHKVKVYYDGKPLPDSPFAVDSKPSGNAAAVVPPNISREIAVNVDYPFTVDATKAGRGNVTCSADGPDGKRHPVTVNQKPNQKTFECKFRPKAPGHYDLNINFGGNPINGSPFPTNATDSGFGGQPLTPEDQMMPSSTNPNRQPSSAFKPMTDPTQTPLNNFADPSKVRVCDLKPSSQPGRSPLGAPVTVGLPATVEASEPQKFLVDASKTAPAPMKCSIVGPTNQEVPTMIADNEDGTFTVNWIPEDLGPHKAKVSYNGKPVPGSPFTTNATPVGNPSGVAPPSIKALIPVGVDYPFTVDASRTGPGPGNVTCSANAPDGKKYPVHVKQRPGQKTYDCTYKPHLPGPHQLNVKFGGNPIRGSPFNTSAAEMQPEYVDEPVTPSTVHPNYQPNSPFLPMAGPEQPPIQGADPSKVKVAGLKPGSAPGRSPLGSATANLPSSVTASEPQQFTVDASQTTPAQMKCSVTDPINRELPMKVADNKNGTYNVQWTPEDVGPHNLKVYYDGKPVPNSPFSVASTPTGNAGAVVPPNINPVVSVNADYPFTVDASKAGPGNVVCSADGPDGKRYPVIVSQRPNQKVFDCKFRPQVAGPYKLNVKFGGNPIRGSPFNTNAVVTEPEYDDEVMSPSSTNPNYQQNKPFAPQGGFGQPLTSDDQMMPSGMNPNKQPSSSCKPLTDPSQKPYNNLADPSKVKVCDPVASSQPGKSPVGAPVAVGLPATVEASEPQKFLVDASKTGAAPLKCSITGPTNQELPTMIVDNENGTYTVGWIPEDLGPHKAKVLYNGKPVPGSPFNTNAVPVGNASAVVPPTINSTIPIGVDYPFTVDASRTGPGPGNVTCSAVAPDGKKYPLLVKQRPNQKVYDCTYKPHVPGPHQLNVKFGGNPIKGSPFNTTAAEVQPGFTDEPITPAMVHPNYQPNSPFLPMGGPEQPPTHGADPSKVKVAGLKPGSPPGKSPLGSPAVNQPSSVTASEPQQFTVDASQAGQAPMRCAVTDPTNRELPMKVADNKNGTFNVQWTPEDLGPHNVKVYYDGKPVPNSPFPVTSKPTGNAAAVVPPNIKPVIPAGVDYPFTVDASKAGRGNITCSADGPDGRRYPVIVSQKPNQKTFDCKFRPQVAGPYQLNVKFGGNPVKGSPFNITATDSEFVDEMMSPSSVNPNYQQNRPFNPQYGPSGQPLTAEDQMMPSSMNPNYHPSSQFPGQGQPLGGKPGQAGPYDPYYNEPGVNPTGVQPRNTAPAFGPGNQNPYGPGNQNPYGPGNQNPYGPGNQNPYGPGNPNPYGDGNQNPQGPGNQNPYGPGNQNPYGPGNQSPYGPGNQGPGNQNPNRPGNQNPYGPGKQGPHGPGNQKPQSSIPGLGEMTPCDFVIPTDSDAPLGAPVVGEVTTPSRRKAVASVYNNNDGTASVHYTPSELGKHQLSVKQNGREVKGSPFAFNVDVISEGKVSTYGPGLSAGIVNQPTFFTVSTKHAKGPGGLKVSVQGPSRVEVQCTDNGDGTCTCQFTPTAPGDYIIEIYFDGKPVYGSPFTCKVVDPFAPSTEEYIPMGSESRVTLKISEPDISVLTATIRSPSGKEEPCKLMRMSNGSIGVSFTPKEGGEHLVNVFKQGKHIPNSPFKITVSAAEIGDASKVRVWGPGTSRGVANQPAKFNIDMSDAGYSNLSLSMEGPSQANLDCTDTENGYCEVTYMPTEPGDYILNIKYGDRHVPGSPFNVHVTGVGSEMRYTERTSKTRRSETQLADVGNSCELSLTLPGSNPEDMKAQVFSPSGKQKPAEVGSDGRNKFNVSFVPDEHGIHQVHVFYRDREIQGSPFQFTVGPMEDQGAGAVKAYGPGLQFAEANQPAEFMILTREAGGGSLSVAVEGPAKTDIELEDNKDGSCNILYYPTLPGEYLVNVKFNDQHIPNSPFKVQVVPGSAPVFPQPDAGLNPDEPASFVITLTNVYNAREVETRLVCPSGREVPCEVQKIDNQGNYAIKFVPTENGDHRVDVYVWGAHVPGSPFLFKVGQARGDATRVFAEGRGLYHGETGKSCEFVVNTCNAGKGTLQVTVDGPSRVTMDCKEVEEGYSVRYIPHVPGEYVITIKYAGPYHINGSPFKASVTGPTLPGYAAEEYSMQQEIVTVDTVAKTRYNFSENVAHQKRAGVNPNADASKVVCRGPALKRAQCNMMNSFQVDTSNAGESMLLVGCCGPTLPADEIIVKYVGSGRYDVRFKPAQPGDHMVVVKWNNEHVTGSPFLVIAT